MHLKYNRINSQLFLQLIIAMVTAVVLRYIILLCAINDAKWCGKKAQFHCKQRIPSNLPQIKTNFSANSF